MSAKKQLIAQDDFNHILFNNSLEGITDEESNKKILPSMNTIKWIAGHCIWAQNNLAKIARVETAIPWLGLFERGSSGAIGEQHPTIDEIKDQWNELHPKIRKGLEAVPDVAMDKKIKAQHPMVTIDDSLGGVWAFQNIHLAYTIGQISILRKGINKQAMKFN